MSEEEAKQAIDRIIRKVKIYSYKPIQIAEILHRHRTNALSLDELENYRVDSRHWRDNVSQRLVGTTSASSSRYQDNLFDENAVPPRHIQALAEQNDNGLVEAYIYAQLRGKWNDVLRVDRYLDEAVNNPDSFDATDFVALFEESSLTKCTDKMYEIMAYAILAEAGNSANANVRVDVEEPPNSIRQTHNSLFSGTTSQDIVVERVGTANAADSGVDIRTNFGPIVQVKHSTISPADVRKICDSVASNHVVIVCSELTEPLENRPDTLQSIITKQDLVNQYNSLRENKTKFQTVVSRMQTEIQDEFPLVDELESFVRDRGYHELENEGVWEVTFEFGDELED